MNHAPSRAPGAQVCRRIRSARWASTRARSAGSASSRPTTAAPAVTISEQIVQLARACATFELEWETDFVNRWDDGESHGGVRARASIPINLFNALNERDLGQGTVTFLGLHHARCMRMSYSGVDDVARVVRLTAKLEYAKDTVNVIPDDPIRTHELVIDLVPGHWQGKLTETCNEDPASMPWLNWPDVYARRSRLRREGRSLYAVAGGSCRACTLRVLRPVRISGEVQELDGDAYLPLEDLVRALEGRVVADRHRGVFTVHVGTCHWCVLEPVGG